MKLFITPRNPEGCSISVLTDWNVCGWNSAHSYGIGASVSIGRRLHFRHNSYSGVRVGVGFFFIVVYILVGKELP